MFPIDFCHIPVSIIKRSAGRSAVAAAAYRSGTKLTNEWDGMTHDYTRKGGIVHAEIMLPAHAPPEFADRSILWNSVEQIEKARDSQLAREIEAALPRELSGEQQLALVRAYVKDNFVDKGMCADFAIHDKGTGNPHVHIMLTLRPLKENGQWGAKCRKAYDLDENGQRMAVTKIHPIKSTLKKALDYIENSAKTDEKMLVSSFACAYETADIEFELLLSQAMQKGNNLAHHLIQSFAPGETTPEQAHEIGRQLADEVLQGKYPYVLTTHIDKGHVHNHVIFCAVDMVNQRKYVSNRQSYAYIRRTSDRLCKEHGLSVVMPGQDRGKSYAEWDARRKGTSWKAKLKIAIDAAIPQAKDFDDFLRLLQEQGYEVKRGKYVSFRAPGQERFTRCKTLGEAYTEEAITERIKGRFVERKAKENRKISLRIDLENSIKAQQSAGYEKWAKLHNLKQAARTLNFLTEHEIESYPDLESRVAEITAASTEAATALKAAERRLAEMAVLIKDVTTCKELRPLVQEYQRAADKKQFRRRHEGTLILYEAAAKALKEQGFQKLPDLYALKNEYKQLAEQKDQMQRQYNDAKRQMQEYGIIKQNVDGILRTAPGKEQMQER